MFTLSMNIVLNTSAECGIVHWRPGYWKIRMQYIHLVSAAAIIRTDFSFLHFKIIPPKGRRQNSIVINTYLLQKLVTVGN